MRALYERRKVEIIEILNSDQMRILDKMMKCLEKGQLEKTACACATKTSSYRRDSES